jgi:fumigaclavine B O-acetyltransferase
MAFYDLDFGSSLGQVENIDLPENRISGVGWVMPARFKGAPWEVRIALEPRVMEGLQRDRLMELMSGKVMPKL